MTRHEVIEAINQRLEQLDTKEVKRVLKMLDKTRAGVPYTGDKETDAVLNDHPDILGRLKRLDSGKSKTIPIEEVAKKHGVKL
jgi:ribosomal 50S subunit-associated protein YjgA (DUF615 family)